LRRACVITDFAIKRALLSLEWCSAMTVTCFDIGGTFLRYGALDGDGMVAEAGRCPVPSEDWAAFREAIATGVSQTGGDAVSISITGSYDPSDGRANVANLPCVHGRLFADELSEHLGKPVHVTNDADCFALAEAHHGAGKGAPTVFAIILGSGVGGGIVANGQLLRGVGGVTGEWGHGSIFSHGPGGYDTPPLPCGCGRSGCLDVIGSARGLEHIHHALHGARLPSLEITKGWMNDGAAESKTVEVYLDLVSRPLSMLVNTLGPQVIPVGGGLSNASELIAALDVAVRERTNAEFPEVLIKPGEFVRDGGLIGAGIVAVQRGLAA
jgi:N-acetylglucosamine kinase